MIDRLEFCPQCQGPKDVCLTIGLKKRLGQPDTEIGDIVYHLHCRSCNAYIRSFPMIDNPPEEHFEQIAIEIPQYYGITPEHELSTV